MPKRPEPTLPPAIASLVINSCADRECLLLDLSPRGAVVVVRDGSGIPDWFEVALFKAAVARCAA